MITTKGSADPLKALRRLAETLDDERLTAAWLRTENRLRAEARRSFDAMVPMARASARTAPEDLASARRIVDHDEALVKLAALAGSLTTATRIRVRVILGAAGNNPKDDRTRRDLARLIGERTVTTLRMLYHCQHPDPATALPSTEAALAPVLGWTGDTRLLYGQTHQLKSWLTALEHAISALTPPAPEHAPAEDAVSARSTGQSARRTRETTQDRGHRTDPLPKRPGRRAGGHRRAQAEQADS
ncbi:hypothetical protein [Kitasatospora purpeofusca]|uniref:hypothetical protein n=1 Tax=Kitasatospora purpeofusca TaxID=67352 RepID=UPI0038060DEF